MLNVGNTQMIGSIRSIFWLSGLDDIVKAIDDPACAIKDEIAICPGGSLPGAFLLNQYLREGKVPFSIYENHEGIQRPSDSVHVWVTTTPSQVTTEVTRPNLAAMYPLGRTHLWPSSIRCVRVKHQKNPSKFVNNCKKNIR